MSADGRLLLERIHVMTRFHARTVAATSLLTLLGACALNNAQKGAVIGAGAGGVVGGVIGNNTGSTARGAIIGAAVGGVAGAVIGHQMDRQAQELAYEIPGATVARVGEGITVTFPEGSLFGYDSDQLMAGARDNMTKFAASLVKYPNTRAMIVGHTDARGSTAYNAELSQRRADATASFIAQAGVARTRLDASGRGESEPIATNDTEAGRQQNRRVEVAIYADDAARRGSN
jgi:outer membrane protein OmpA-like peptidoglycan-associated protein